MTPQTSNSPVGSGVSWITNSASDGNTHHTIPVKTLVNYILGQDYIEKKKPFLLPLLC